MVICQGAPKGLTDSGSAFKASQKMGQRFKVSSDRLVEPVIERGMRGSKDTNIISLYNLLTIY